jgi:hypothetical protein
MKNFKSEPAKTCLTIATGFIVVYLVSHWQPAIYIALAVGAIGVFSEYLSQKIEWAWQKLAYLLSLVVPNILLSAVFYLFLFPIALLSRLFGKSDPLMLKNHKPTIFVDSNKTFGKANFEKPW